MLSKEELIHIITHPESASMHRVHLVARELLSLREISDDLKKPDPLVKELRRLLEVAESEVSYLGRQLAELKALQPFGYIDPRTLADDGCSGGTWMKRQPREIGPYTMPLFTAAKP